METYIITIEAWLMLELLAYLISKTPLWITRQYVNAVKRLWKSTAYLKNILIKERFNRWDSRKKQYIIFHTTSTKSQQKQSVYGELSSNTHRYPMSVLLGKPGAGKTATLEALTYKLAHHAYIRHLVIWLFLIFVSILLLFFNPIFSILWLFSFILWFPLLGKIHMPIFIEARWYDGQSMREWLGGFEERNFGEKPLFWQSECTIFLVDGVNEIQATFYEKFIEGWRELLQDIHPPLAIFTSRLGEDPSLRLGTKRTLVISELSDGEVKDFIDVYRSGKRTASPREVDHLFRTLKSEGLLTENGFGRNPYCLKIMIESEHYTQKQAILISSYVECLIQREIEEKPETHKRTPVWKIVPLNLELEMLSSLALYMHESHILAISRNKWEDAEAIICDRIADSSFSFQDILGEAEASSLLQVRYRESFEFTHQLLQDFFAACALCREENWNYVEKDENILWWYQTLIFTGELLFEKSLSSYDEFALRLLDDTVNIPHLLVTIGLLAKTQRIPPKIITIIEENFILLLKDKQENVIYELIRELNQIGGKTSAHLAINILAKSVDKHEQVADILVRLGELAVPPLIEVYLSTHEVNSKEILNVLLQIGEPALLQLFYNFDRLENSQDVINAMAEIENPIAIDILFKASNDPHDSYKLFAAIIIANHHCTPLNYYKFLYSLENPNDWIRWIASYALGIIGEQEAIPYLEEIAYKDNGFFLIQDMSPFETIPPMGKVDIAAQDAIQMIRQSTSKDKLKKGVYIVSLEHQKLGGADIKTLLRVKLDEKGK